MILPKKKNKTYILLTLLTICVPHNPNQNKKKKKWHLSYYNEYRVINNIKVNIKIGTKKSAIHLTSPCINILQFIRTINKRILLQLNLIYILYNHTRIFDECLYLYENSIKDFCLTFFHSTKKNPAIIYI